MIKFVVSKYPLKGSESVLKTSISEPYKALHNRHSSAPTNLPALKILTLTDPWHLLMTTSNGYSISLTIIIFIWGSIFLSTSLSMVQATTVLDIFSDLNATQTSVLSKLCVTLIVTLWMPEDAQHPPTTPSDANITTMETLEIGGYDGIFTEMLLRGLKSDDWKKVTTYVGLACLLNKSDTQTPVVAASWSP
ncbi:hypothetical protein IW261DRAFT_1412777 [Armillaria novae-zelandiae]|uniref:Uncharacterized protein n=1 Tax=Armillaria novae-zelandiae TaxID=153914 RepID=A0AA39PTN0_9AGAR|nr:hypothetical protein IW261DRAFT_1412777 [Armillaria novae-zelandiae]